MFKFVLPCLNFSILLFFTPKFLPMWHPRDTFIPHPQPQTPQLICLLYFFKSPRSRDGIAFRSIVMLLLLLIRLSDCTTRVIFFYVYKYLFLFAESGTVWLRPLFQKIQRHVLLNSNDDHKLYKRTGYFPLNRDIWSDIPKEKLINPMFCLLETPKWDRSCAGDRDYIFTSQ